MLAKKNEAGESPEKCKNMVGEKEEWFLCSQKKNSFSWKDEGWKQMWLRELWNCEWFKEDKHREWFQIPNNRITFPSSIGDQGKLRYIKRTTTVYTLNRIIKGSTIFIQWQLGANH